MTASTTVSRAQVLRYRMVAQGLDRTTDEPTDLAVLDLGVQDTPVRSARAALAARLRSPSATVVDDADLTLAWTLRGAPHLHRPAELPALSRALWPLSDADARSRLAAERASLAEAGIEGLDAFRAVTTAMRDVVTGPMVKGEVSRAVTAALPDAYARWCEPCGSTHVYGGIFQLAGLFAGVRLEPGQVPAVLAPLDDRPPIPDAAEGTGDVLLAYLRLHGPATAADAARYVGTTKTALRPVWPDDLVEVDVDGRRAWLPADRLDALTEAAPPAGTVRLLPPADPWLQGRDRDLLVPDRARQKAVWRMIGNPGAVLVDGEVVAVWRAKARGKRLELTVEPFDPFPAAVRTAVEAEAERVAAGRDAADVTVRYADT